MIRTLLVQDGVVAAARLSEAPLSEAERRAWLLGSEADEAAELPPGEILELAGAAAEAPIGAGWRREGEGFAPPPGPARVIPASVFVSCFTPAETAALLAIPELAQAALLAAAQGAVNLDSPRLAALMALAVAEGALTEARAEAVMRGEPAPA
jgi:hypothetical protein